MARPAGAQSERPDSLTDRLVAIGARTATYVLMEAGGIEFRFPRFSKLRNNNGLTHKDRSMHRL